MSIVIGETLLALSNVSMNYVNGTEKQVKENAKFSDQLGTTEVNNIVNESNGKLTVNKIASKSCLTQSTVQHIMDKSYKDVKLLTIVRLCDGLGLTLKEFFSDELFDNIDRDD